MFMKEVGKIMQDLVLVKKFIKIITYMRENGKIIKNMEIV